MPRDQAAGENLQAKIPIAKSLGRSASRRQNKLSTEVLECIARVHAELPRKIAVFANDRADLCRTRNMGRFARTRVCERKDVELVLWPQPCRLRCLGKQPPLL